MFHRRSSTTVTVLICNALTCINKSLGPQFILRQNLPYKIFYMIPEAYELLQSQLDYTLLAFETVILVELFC